MVDLGSGALSESKISEQSEKITFSMEWLNSLSLEEKKSIDFRQVDFSEFIDSHIKIPKLMGGKVPPSRKMSSGDGEASSDNTIDRMSGAIRLATASDFNRILGEAQVDALKPSIRMNADAIKAVEVTLKEYRALASKLNNAGIGHST
jgi:hypothetical protein